MKTTENVNVYIYIYIYYFDLQNNLDCLAKRSQELGRCQ